jgi:2-polyprenyl-3-methyl-5-hydroxy-6-metoxy-1,4-benzoquinol methylase
MASKIKRILFNLYDLSLREVIYRVRTNRAFQRSRSGIKSKARQIREELQKRFNGYQTSNLHDISTEEFSHYIQSWIGTIDAQSEGYSENELESQRDSSIKFYWGHNHDFGAFKLAGRMGERHINNLAHFMALFPVSFEDFRDKEVLDVGCWTGGTTLSLASVGSNVFAIEEVKKYADMASFLVKSFGLSNRVSVNHLSLYDCNSEEFFDRFDIVYFPGVLYHLSDPLLALRILFNSLKVGGKILIESEGLERDEPFCRFDGSLIYSSGTKDNLTRTGWNWFVPSPSALHRMMREAGFDDIKTVLYRGPKRRKRLYGYGKKVAQVGICKAGLSVPTIR